MTLHLEAQQLGEWLREWQLVDGSIPLEELLYALDDGPPGPDALARVLVSQFDSDRAHHRDATEETVFLEVSFEALDWFGLFNRALASEPFRFVRVARPPAGDPRHKEDARGEIWARVLRGPSIERFPELLRDADARHPYVDEWADDNWFYGPPPSDPKAHDEELDRVTAFRRFGHPYTVELLGDLVPDPLVKLAQAVDIELQAARSSRRLYALGSWNDNDCDLRFAFLVTTPAIADEIARRGYSIIAACDAHEDWYEEHPIAFDPDATPDDE